MRDDLGAEFEGAASVLLLPKKMVGVGQHFGRLEFTGFDQPAMKNLEEKITLEIDVYRLDFFVAPFRAASAQGLLGRAHVKLARGIAAATDPFDPVPALGPAPGTIAIDQVLECDSPESP